MSSCQALLHLIHQQCVGPAIENTSARPVHMLAMLTVPRVGQYEEVTI